MSSGNPIANLVNEINPHMPQYLVKAPWYLNQTDNTLDFQRNHNDESKIPITEYTQKGLLPNKIYKYRKGACENCGAITHKTKECCERPRKRGAKYTQSNFKPDEYIKEVELDFAGKRDRWNGYTPDMGKRLIDEYELITNEKERIKQEKLKNAKTEKERKMIQRDEDLEEDISSDEENDIPNIFKQIAQRLAQKDTENDTNSDKKEVLSYFEDYKSKNNNTLPTKIEEIPRKILYHLSTSKSLHIGEDYSKYLLNLALNSAYYDAKSRSMRENPLATSEINTFKGENCLYKAGDVVNLIEEQKFIDEANQKNKELNLNMIAMPSQAELFYKYVKQKKSLCKSESLKRAIDKYGGKEYFEKPDNLNTKVKETIKSCYEENVYINGHTSVWGSFYHKSFGWGYNCCLSFIKNSFCEGEKARQINLNKLKEYDKDINKDINKEINKDNLLHNKRKRDSNE